MTLKMTKRQAELMRELLIERTRVFDQKQFKGEGQLDLLQEYEELFYLFGGAEEPSEASSCPRAVGEGSGQDGGLHIQA